MAARDVTVHVRTATYPSGQPIDEVYVALHDVDGFFLEDSSTDDTGNAVFAAVTPGLYKLRVAPPRPGVVVNGNNRSITVEDEDNNLFDVAINYGATSSSMDPNLCRCSGYLVNAGGANPYGSTYIHFDIHDGPSVLSRSGRYYGVLGTSITASVDDRGFTSIDLIRGATYVVTFPGLTSGTLCRQITVPNLSSADISNVLYPILDAVHWAQGSTPITPYTSPTLTMSVGEETSLTVSGVYTSGLVGGVDSVDFATTDSTILSFSVDGDSRQVRLFANGTGTASITLTRKDSVDMYSKPSTAVVGALEVTVE